jgi:hypothetical protein
VCALLSQLSSMNTKRAKRGYAYYFRRGKIEVDPDTGCWIWMGAERKSDGYGSVVAWTGTRWMATKVHRYFYELYHRKLPTEIDVGHTCHRRLCIHPRHLVERDHPANMREMFQDQKFTEEQKQKVRLLLQAGFTIGYIAGKMQAPRPYIMRLTKILDWRTLELFD